MLKLVEIKEDSSKKIEIYNNLYRNLLSISVEFYHNDNMLFPDFDLEYPYKFEAYSAIPNINETNSNSSNSINILSYNSLMTIDETKYNNRGYRKVLKLKSIPKKVENGELLLYFYNNNLQLLHSTNVSQKLGCVIEEELQNLIVSFIDTYSRHNEKRNKTSFKIIEEFDLNQIFKLTLFVKVGVFNEIADIYYTTEFVIKDEVTL